MKILKSTNDGKINMAGGEEEFRKANCTFICLVIWGSRDDSKFILYFSPTFASV